MKFVLRNKFLILNMTKNISKIIFARICFANIKKFAVSSLFNLSVLRGDLEVCFENLKGETGTKDGFLGNIYSESEHFFSEQKI